MSVTLQDLRDTVYDILKEEEQDSNAYPLSLIDETINSAYNEICAGTVIDVNTRQYIRKGKLPFLQEHKFYANILSTSLSADATLGDTTLDITDTTNYPSTGKIWVAGNIITYTGKTATTFTGCSNVLYAHDSGTRVFPVFDLPNNYMATVQVSYNNATPVMYYDENEIYEILLGNKGAWSTTGYSYIPTTSSVQYPQNRAFYTIADGLYFLPFFIDNNTGMFHLVYEKKVTALSDGADAVIITNDILAKNTIPYCAVAEMLFNRGEEERAARVLNYFYSKLKSFYNYYNRLGSETSQRKVVTLQKGGRLNI